MVGQRVRGRRGRKEGCRKRVGKKWGTRKSRKRGWTKVGRGRVEVCVLGEPIVLQYLSRKMIKKNGKEDKKKGEEEGKTRKFRNKNYHIAKRR